MGFTTYLGASIRNHQLHSYRCPSPAQGIREVLYQSATLGAKVACRPAVGAAAGEEARDWSFRGASEPKGEAESSTCVAKAAGLFGVPFGSYGHLCDFISLEVPSQQVQTQRRKGGHLQCGNVPVGVSPREPGQVWKPG